MIEDPDVQQLRQLQAEAGTLKFTDSPEFTSWRLRTLNLLTRLFGPNHDITEAFRNVRFVPRVLGPSNQLIALSDALTRGVRRAVGVLDAAVSEWEALLQTPASNDSAIDPELWKHVSPHVANEEWGKVASQTAIFTEDRIRKWAGRPPDEVGEKLMTELFGDRGDYRLGLTEGERQGWHRLAMGVSMALRNADAHRIQQRPDHQRYAMGVLGASSLLLTQLRYEHGNRFHDTSPAEPEDAGM